MALFNQTAVCSLVRVSVRALQKIKQKNELAWFICKFNLSELSVLYHN